jgi:hypothetical protein
MGDTGFDPVAALPLEADVALASADTVRLRCTETSNGSAQHARIVALAVGNLH